MKGYLKYIGRKLVWYLFTFVIALLLFKPLRKLTERLYNKVRN